ncbi:MAG: hypothetical protein KDA58_15620, partial [Planctomycetaceae bacterium]|nr:hypothetical protein [Planctomycetaceae bacterium]
MSVTVLRMDRVPASSLGCYGGWQFATPAIDTLAANGIVCNHLYCFDRLLDVAAIVANARIVPVTVSAELESLGPLLDSCQRWHPSTLSEYDDEQLEDLWGDFVEAPEKLADLPLSLRLGLHAYWVEEIDRNLVDLFDTLESENWVLLSGSGEPLVERELGLDARRPLRPAMQHLPLLFGGDGLTEIPARITAPLAVDDLPAVLAALDADGTAADDSVRAWRTGIHCREEFTYQTSDAVMSVTPQWWCHVPGGDADTADVDKVALFHRPDDPWGL